MPNNPVKPRYQAFRVNEEFFVCWDLKDDKPREIGFAASYITLTGHYAHKQAYELNGRGLATDWKDDETAEPLPLSKIVSLVSYMAALMDYNMKYVPSLLDKVKDMLEEYEADQEARRMVNEIYGNDIS